MIKFEEHDGKLFRMLEKPVPLTDDAELPVLVRMIQDDTMLGKANKRRIHPDALAQKIICIVLTDDGLFMDGNYAYRYEIIGCLVTDGSKEWAWHQMTQGEKVTFRDYPNRILKLVNGYIQDSISDGFWNRKSGNEFLSYASSPGWQIYKEPELKYKVGDWVEIESSHTKGKTFVSVIKEMPNQGHYTVRVNSSFGVYTVYGVMERQIIRKLKPSEVVVKIGCLSGTVEPVSINGTHIWFHLIGVNDRTIATIRISSLDTQTRELVESLIKGQEEG